MHPIDRELGVVAICFFSPPVLPMLHRRPRCCCLLPYVPMKLKLDIAHAMNKIKTKKTRPACDIFVYRTFETGRGTFSKRKKREKGRGCEAR